MEKDEKHEVEIWRQEKLEEAGFPRFIAYDLARDLGVNLHEALELAASGCPTELVSRILAAL